MTGIESLVDEPTRRLRKGATMPEMDEATRAAFLDWWFHGDKDPVLASRSAAVEAAFLAGVEHGRKQTEGQLHDEAIAADYCIGCHNRSKKLSRLLAAAEVIEEKLEALEGREIEQENMADSMLDDDMGRQRSVDHHANRSACFAEALVVVREALAAAVEAAEGGDGGQ
jgi:hypothetical protein